MDPESLKEEAEESSANSEKIEKRAARRRVRTAWTVGLVFVFGKWSGEWGLLGGGLKVGGFCLLKRVGFQESFREFVLYVSLCPFFPSFLHSFVLFIRLFYGLHSKDSEHPTNQGNGVNNFSFPVHLLFFRHSFSC